jgi:hypothetical protein
VKLCFIIRYTSIQASGLLVLRMESVKISCSSPWMEKTVFLSTRLPIIIDHMYVVRHFLNGFESHGGAYRLERKGISSAHRNWPSLDSDNTDIYPSVEDVVILPGLWVSLLNDFMLAAIVTYPLRR